jgi:hypothetical protein
MDMVSDLWGDAEFLISTGSRVNPGNSALFPRLYQLASVFEKYRFHKLVFHYKPISAATRSGTVVMLMETDAVDAAPQDKQQMLNHINSVRTTPWAPVSLSIKQPDLHPRPQMFIRLPNTPTTDTDRRLDDLGVLYLAQNVDSGTPIAIGELWVEYDLEFISPCTHSEAAASTIYVKSAPSDIYDQQIDVDVNLSESPAQSTWGDAFTWIDTSVTPNLLSISGYRDFDALLSYFLRGTDLDWGGGGLTLTAENGAVLRSSAPNGDRTGISDVYGYAENLLSMTGFSNWNPIGPVNLSDLPVAKIAAAAISVGYFVSGFFRLTPVRSSVNASPFPPSSLKSLLRSGKFHLHGKDHVFSDNEGHYLPGRGQVPKSAPLRALLNLPLKKKKNDSGRGHDVEPTHCEGACSSVPSKFTFK